jgi:heme exporter protein C
MSETAARAYVRAGTAITVVALLALAGVYVLALRFTPTELRQGLAQKIFYLHVPAAWNALLAFAVVGLCGGLYLWLKDRRLDRVAESSAEVGVALGVVMLTTGPIWAKPIWGTWWTWDARLTSTALLFVIYLGYLLLRSVVEDPERAATYAAVLGIVGALDVPIIHFSVEWWRTLHQPATVLKPQAPSMDPAMYRALLVNVAAFLATFAYLGARRYRSLTLQAERLAEAVGRL